MAIAAQVAPRVGAVAALLALTLLGGHEPRNRSGAVAIEAPPVPTIVALGKTIDPGPFADAREWPRGMVIRPPKTRDEMPSWIDPGPDQPRGPVTALLSGLFELLGSRGA